ncbi:MAG: FAD-dependent thymidylate synthase [Deltaproteobacteria bacterium]|nr:FAD-dependent thymidylate synthase [Deltaproteobacteria bacterium]
MSLKVVLAGHNVDRQALDAHLAGQGEGQSLSPETLSAAYARISRDPRDVPELRADARAEVETSRRSNKAIIFDMGHSSVAEHAVFNLDVMGISRLAAESLEQHRLASYTEKSQRYIRLEGDYVLPAELADDAGMQKAYRMLMDELAECYKTLAARLTELARDEGGEGQKRSELESRANEDARYVLPLGAQAQLGMTVNARTLELMIARLASHPLDELRALSRALYQAVADTAPSVVRYTEPTDYFSQTPRALRAAAADWLPAPGSRPDLPEVELVACPHEPDLQVAAGLLAASSAQPFSVCLQAAESAEPDKLRALFAEVFSRMQLWDTLPRAFEMVDFTFELSLSAAAFAQVKRHRMATVLAQAYEPRLGRTTPASIERAGLTQDFHLQLDRCEQVYSRAMEISPEAAPYCLSNAHRRRALFKLNGRALGHFARLRCDREAQWDIRRIGHLMVEAAQERMPLAGAFYGGKDCIEDLREKVL